MLSGGTQRRALPRNQNENFFILNISFPRVEIEPITCSFYSLFLCVYRVTKSDCKRDSTFKLKNSNESTNTRNKNPLFFFTTSPLFIKGCLLDMLEVIRPPLHIFFMFIYILFFVFLVVLC